MCSWASRQTCPSVGESALLPCACGRGRVRVRLSAWCAALFVCVFFRHVQDPRGGPEAEEDRPQAGQRGQRFGLLQMLDFSSLLDGIIEFDGSRPPCSELASYFAPNERESGASTQTHLPTCGLTECGDW